MNENKRFIIVGAIVALLILTIIVSSVLENKKITKSLETLTSTINSDSKQIIYLGRPTCSYCMLLKPSLDKLSKDYEFEYLYVNTDEMSKQEFNKVLKLLNLKSKEFGTPYIAVYNKGQKVSEQPGFIEHDALFDYFKANGFINESETLAINYVNYSKYKEIINQESGEKQIVLIGFTGNEDTTKALDELEKVAKETKYKINYFNLNTIKTQEEFDKYKLEAGLKESEDFKNSKITIFEKGNVVSSKDNAMTKEEYIKYFKENNILGE